MTSNQSIAAYPEQLAVRRYEKRLIEDGLKVTGQLATNEDIKVVTRDGQWLGSGDVFADFGEKEVIVALAAAALNHRLLAELPDNEQAQSVRTSREAMHFASLAASHAQARDCIDDDGHADVIALEGADEGLRHAV